MKNIKTGNYSENEMKADKDKFKKEFMEVRKSPDSVAQVRAILPDSVKGLDKASQKIQNSTLNKVEMQRLVRNKKAPEVKPAFGRKAKPVVTKPVVTKPKRSIWDIVKGKRKIKGDSLWEKVQKQRKGRNPVKKKEPIKDPTKIHSKPFRK